MGCVPISASWASWTLLKPSILGRVRVPLWQSGTHLLGFWGGVHTLCIPMTYASCHSQSFCRLWCGAKRCTGRLLGHLASTTYTLRPGSYEELCFTDGFLIFSDMSQLRMTSNAKLTTSRRSRCILCLSVLRPSLVRAVSHLLGASLCWTAFQEVKKTSDRFSKAKHEKSP